MQNAFRLRNGRALNLPYSQTLASSLIYPTSHAGTGAHARSYAIKAGIHRGIQRSRAAPDTGSSPNRFSSPSPWSRDSSSRNSAPGSFADRPKPRGQPYFNDRRDRDRGNERQRAGFPPRSSSARDSRDNPYSTPRTARPGVRDRGLSREERGEQRLEKYAERRGEGFGVKTADYRQSARLSARSTTSSGQGVDYTRAVGGNVRDFDGAGDRPRSGGGRERWGAEGRGAGRDRGGSGAELGRGRGSWEGDRSRPYRSAEPFARDNGPVGRSRPRPSEIEDGRAQPTRGFDRGRSESKSVGFRADRAGRDDLPGARSRDGEYGNRDRSFGSREEETRAPRRSVEEFSRDSFGDRRAPRPDGRERFVAREREELVPLSMPYTTPASIFLYGTSVVQAALSSDRRKFYKLYVFQGAGGEEHTQKIKIAQLAKGKDVEVKYVGPSWIGLLDKTASGRPHNGFILEASPLKRLPIVALEKVDESAKEIEVVLDHQSKEDLEINGRETKIAFGDAARRQPFVLFLDGVVDTGNLGGILRSAYFLGVDLVATSTSCGPLNPVTLKASAGAVESLPLVSVHDTSSFIERSKKAGWQVWASVAPPRAKHDGGGAGGGGKSAAPGARPPETHFSTKALQGPLHRAPCILMIGGEGSGLKPDLQKKAQYTVSIEGGRANRGGVDSLNVSVAVGMLVEAFLRKAEAGKGQTVF